MGDGAPEPEHDVDFVVAEERRRAAVSRWRRRVRGRAAAGGLAVQGIPATVRWSTSCTGSAASRSARTLIGDAEEMDLLGIRMPVLRRPTVMIAKLRSLSEQYCDFGALLPVFRAVREQLDWRASRRGQ